MKRQLQILENPMLMSMEHEIEYIEKGDKRLLDEYNKLSLLDRGKIEIAIKMYSGINIELEDSSNYYPIYIKGTDSKLRYWYSNNSLLSYQLSKIDFRSFYTLSNNEKKMIESFMNMCVTPKMLGNNRNFDKYLEFMILI
ncbi:MAG: hypothetical protein ACHQF4_04210 [Sphingobacteriales bacterium]